MKWFVKCIKNYVNFTGRARRMEYWYFVLFAFLFMVVARTLDFMLFEQDRQIISSLFGFFIFLPQLAVQVRRLHDIGRSGVWVLWVYITVFVWIVALMISGASNFMALMSGAMDVMPTSFLSVLFGGLFVLLIWGIVFLVWFCTPGTEGENKYGPDSKQVVE